MKFKRNFKFPNLIEKVQNEEIIQLPVERIDSENSLVF